MTPTQLAKTLLKEVTLYTDDVSELVCEHHNAGPDKIWNLFYGELEDLVGEDIPQSLVRKAVDIATRKFTDRLEQSLTKLQRW